MSTYDCPVVRVRLEPCPNADNLAIVKVDGYQVVVRKDEWHDGDLGVYIGPDYVVPLTGPHAAKFEFMARNPRVQPRRFRGQWSEGLLIPAEADMAEGDNAYTRWGIGRWEPPEDRRVATKAVYDARSRLRKIWDWLIGRSSPLTSTTRPGPKGITVPVYDVENWRKYQHVMDPTMTVRITEKIHGCNARYVFWNGKMYVGSRNRWTSPGSLWWAILKKYPAIELYCRVHPGHVVFGEVYGQVQNMKYETADGEYLFAAFDIYDGPNRRYLLPHEIAPIAVVLPWVPVLYQGPYDVATILRLTDENSVLYKAPHYREGVVITEITGRTVPEFRGRLILKSVSNNYLTGTTP